MTDVFIHVPSTAGTTLWTIFRRVYGEDVCRIRTGNVEANEETLRQLLSAPTGAPPLVGGHVRVSALGMLRERARCISLLRDPVGRVVSHWYRKIRDGERPSAGDPAAPDPSDLAEFGEGWGLQGLEYLSSLDATELRRRNAGFTERDVDELCQMIWSNMWFVGFVEDYDRSLVALARRLGWPMIPHYDRQNRGGNRRPIPAAVLGRLAEATRLEDRVVTRLRERSLASWRRTIPRFVWRHYAYSLTGTCRRALKSLKDPSYRSRHLRQGPRARR
jgi:Sulfotransferase family